MHVGNIAHLSGAAVGALVGLMLVRKPWLPMAGVIFMAAVAIVPVYWNPLSPVWNFDQGYKSSDPTKAIQFYRRSMDRGFEGPEAWHNIAINEARLGHAKEYKDALDHLKKINPKDASEFPDDINEMKARL